MISDLIKSSIETIHLVFNCLKSEGFDILSDKQLPLEFSIEISNLIKTYVTSDIKYDLSITLFKLYECFIRKKLPHISLSYKISQKLNISKFVFWEFFVNNNFDLEIFRDLFLNERNLNNIYKEVELFLYDYFRHLLLNYNDRYLSQLSRFIQLAKRSPKHSNLCPQRTAKGVHVDLFGNVYCRSIPDLINWISVGNSTSDSCQRCVTTLDSQLCSEILITTASLFQIDDNHNAVKVISDRKFQVMWNLPESSLEIQYISSIYKVVSGTSIDLSTYQDDAQFLDSLFNKNNQLVLSLLQKCFSVHMHHHLSENLNNFNIVDNYHLSVSCIIINTILTVIINENQHFSLSDLQLNINTDEIKKFSRKYLKLVTQKLKKDYETVFSDPLCHIDFLTWCLKSHMCVKEIFTWYVDSSIFDSIIEDRILLNLNDLVSYLVDPVCALKLAERICAVNEMNLPSIRYIKLLKLIILKMSEEMKIQTLLELSALQKKKIFCPSINFEASLRKSCNQLSGDVENFEEIQLDLEYLLLVDPVRVLSELLKSALLKSGTREFILKIIEKFEYILCTKINESEYLIIDVFSRIFLTDEDNQSNLMKDNILEQVEFCLNHVFQLMTNNYLADAILTEIIIPHLNVEFIDYNPIFALLFILIKQTHLQNEDFHIKLTSLLIALAHLHLNLYENGYCYCAAVNYIEMSIEILINDLICYIDQDFLINYINSLSFSFTKLLFWQIYKLQREFIILPTKKNIFLSNEILEKYFIKINIDNNTSNSDEDEDILNDLANVMILCSTSKHLLEVATDALPSSDENTAWNHLSRTHVVTVLFELISQTHVNHWINMLKFLQISIESQLINWFYSTQSSLVPLQGNIEYSSNLLVLSVIQDLMDIGSSSVTDKNWLSKLIKLVISSLFQLIPKDLSNLKSRSYDFVKFEILLHLLKFCTCFESKDDYGLQSVLLFAQPLLIKLADDAPSMSQEMQRLLYKLSGFEKFLMF